MIRFLISTAIAMAASAIGLLAADLFLDDVSVGLSGFIIAVAIFTVTTALVNPFIMKMAMKKAQALLGASALITTFVGLLVTHIVSDSLRITGLSTWLFATLIVWLASLLAAVIIPIVLVKKGVQNVRDNNN